LALLLATFFGIILPSAKVLDLIVKRSAAWLAAPVKLIANAAVLAATIHLVIMVFL
jgi:hypothetical protein